MKTYRRQLALLTLLTFIPLLLACGQEASEQLASTDSAIVGGITDDGHMYVVGVGDGSGPWCSGTVISTNTVLTAAHCADLPISQVYFGTVWMGPPAPMAVSQVVVHPDWTMFPEIPGSSDLALVKTVLPIPVQPVTLLRKTLDNSASYMGPDWTFVGYGVDDGFQQTGGGVKRVAAFPFKELGPTMASDGNPVGAGFIYYETNLQSGCNGDSGGPSFFIDGPIEKQGAVTSWGSPGCQQYGVYARIDQPYLNSFIQPTIDLFEPNNPCKNDGVCNESCNNSQIVDADCAAVHCAADGVCAIACVNPVDPDCAFLAVDHCGEDGVCDPGCPQPDPDCGGSSSSSTVSSSSASSSSASSSVASSASSSSTVTSGVGGGGTGGTGGAGGVGGAPPADDDDNDYSDDLLYGRGCGVEDGGSGTTPQWWWLLAMVPWLRRRRTLRFSRRGYSGV